MTAWGVHLTGLESSVPRFQLIGLTTQEKLLAYIQFLGAAGTVTGSKHLINTNDDGQDEQVSRC